MNYHFWDRKIPTILAIALIIVGITATSFLVQKGIIPGGTASLSEIPQHIRITNITDTSFTLTYTTDARVVGSLAFSQDSNHGQTILDDRDQVGNPTPHIIHSITAKSLQSNTTYFFSITSGTHTILDHDKLFLATTAPSVKSVPSSQIPLTGKVVLPTGESPSEAIVYIENPELQAISGVTNTQGEYTLALGNIRNNDLTSFASLSQDTLLHLTIIGDSLTSHIVIAKKDVNPIPLVTISNDYDFTVSTNPLASVVTATSSSLTTFPSPPSSSSGTVKIVTPKKDEGFVDQQPVFKGTALPNKKVDITINSTQELKTQITTDASGNWTFRPITPLSPGQHTITITTIDASGILKTIQQSFIVYAQGSQVSQSTTPSLAPTSQPTPTPTTIPTTIPTVVPTAIPTPPPTLTPIPFPTTIVLPSPTPTLFIPLPSPTQTPISKPGNDSLVFIGIASIITTITGIALFLLTRSSTSL